MGFFRDMLGRESSGAAAARNEDAALQAEAAALFQIKQNLLAQARSNAAQAGSERPSLEDYRLACEAFAQTEQGQTMAADGRWNPKNYADLTGQDLSGFAITDPTGKTTNRSPTADFLNQDSDGAIADFYTNVNFNQANLKDAFVQPATSFNEEIAKAKNLEGLTFDGMKQGDVFQFASAATYQDIKMTHVNGGEIVFVRGTVNGLEIDGKEANISIGSNELGSVAVVNNLSVSDGFRILTLDMEPGSRLVNSDLGNATISMASNVKGAVFQNVNIGGNLDGLDLSGAKLYNFRIDGKLVENTQQLAGLGVSIDSTTVVAADPAVILKEQALAAGEALRKSLNSPNPVAAAPAVPAIDPVPQVAAPAAAAASAVASANSVEDLGKILKGQMEQIGKPLTEQENANLAAIRAKNEARAESQSVLPSRG